VTKPRTSTTRELFGIIGKFPNASKIQAQWNAYFKKEGIDAFMDRYKTSVENLPERLSEMFHFDRRMYLVGSDLQEAIIPLLDELDEMAQNKGKVNVILNRKGVFSGKYEVDLSAKKLLS